VNWEGKSSAYTFATKVRTSLLLAAVNMEIKCHRVLNFFFSTAMNCGGETSRRVEFSLRFMLPALNFPRVEPGG
jgi:hypothetical protein